MSPRDVGVAEGYSPAGLSDDVASFLDPTRRRRRGRRRHAESASDDARLRRLMFGGFSLRALGGLLLVAGVLVMTAGVFVASWDGPVGAYFDGSGYDHRRLSDHDQDYAYAYADYARRFDAGTAWSGWRADPELWTADPDALATGGLICLVGVGLLALARGRTSRDD